MSLKSISSFLATILLIGFTISTGIIVYYFVSTLPRTQTQQISSQASKVLSCAGATFDVKVRNCNLLNGLVLWLPMDEGSGTIAYDYSGNNNNGTLYNGTSICSNPPTSGCPTWVDGKFGKALSFDGVDDYVIVPEILPIQGTLEFWFKPNWNGNDNMGHTLFDASLGDKYFVLDKASSSPKGGACYANSLRWLIEDENDKDMELCIDGTFIQAGNWYHIAVTWRYNGNLHEIFVNGERKAYIIYSLAGKPSLSLPRIGFYTINYMAELNGANGTIDEVRIYNRALSDDEIKQLYYNGLTNKFNITIGLLNSGFADLGNSFTAIVYLKNGTILQLPLILDNNLSKGYYLEKTLTIDGYYPSYGLVDKIMVCSNDCQEVCSEIKVNNQC